MEKPLNIFCCYARADQSYLIELKKGLTPHQRNHLITIHADIDISPGENWEQKISYYLSTAHIILLLVSPDFLASDYCWSKEMTRALERHSEGTTWVIPIILRPVDLQSVPFAKTQVLPTGAKPISEWSNQDAAFLDVTNGIKNIIEKPLSSLYIKHSSMAPRQLAKPNPHVSAPAPTQLTSSHTLGVQESLQPSTPAPTKGEKAATILSYLMPMAILLPSYIPLLLYVIVYAITFWFGRKSQIIRFHLIQSFIFALCGFLSSLFLVILLVILSHADVHNNIANTLLTFYAIFYIIPSFCISALILFDRYAALPLISFFAKKLANMPGIGDYYK